MKKYFKEQVLPILSPQIVDAGHPFPHLLNKELYVTAMLKAGSRDDDGDRAGAQFRVGHPLSAGA